LATTGYSGHSFWDGETWMYPTMALFYPEVARNLLQYRSDRIPEASANAALNGFKVVHLYHLIYLFLVNYSIIHFNKYTHYINFYVFIFIFVGPQVPVGERLHGLRGVPLAAGSVRAPPHGRHRYAKHTLGVTFVVRAFHCGLTCIVVCAACAALAVQQYWRLTRDKQWLKEEGINLAVGIAAFWISHVEWNSTTQVRPLPSIRVCVVRVRVRSVEG
jgi:hypothetical protein